MRTGSRVERVYDIRPQDKFAVAPIMALFLADRGEGEQAVELYALASRYPFVTNSHWFEDVAGKHIAATLPPEVVAAATERGRARDLESTVAELLVELGDDIND